jgi:beta-glucosidase
MPDRFFPEGFLWGAASSAYQTEGGNEHADWWHWELNGGGTEPSGMACDSWNRWADDIAAAVELGLGVFRMSVEWSRVEPQPGHFDNEAIAHYRQVLEAAKAAGLTTMLVLWHFTNPVWLGRRPWTRMEHVDQFISFTERIVPSLAPHVDLWATVNEANTFAWHGYITGDWPPGRHDAWIDARRVYTCLGQAHIRARRVIRHHVGDSASVGLTHVLAWPHPALQGGGLSALTRWWWALIGNDLFLDQLRGEMDWLGVQYYYDSPCRALGVALDDGDTPRTDMGWRVCPEGLYHVVMTAWRRYGVPVIVTENGIADAADVQRGRFIIDHLAWLHEAIRDGADVRGYLHWSLIDNYEWAHGFAPRFGLVEVDYETFKRRPRKSGYLLGRIARENAIPEGLGSELRYADGTGSLVP